MARPKINATFIVVRKEKSSTDASISSNPLTLGRTYNKRETSKTKHCRRYGVLYDAGEDGLATMFVSRRAASRAVKRTIAFANHHNLDAWPQREEDLQVVGVNLSSTFGKDFKLGV